MQRGSDFRLCFKDVHCKDVVRFKDVHCKDVRCKDVHCKDVRCKDVHFKDVMHFKDVHCKDVMHFKDVHFKDVMHFKEIIHTSKKHTSKQQQLHGHLHLNRIIRIVILLPLSKPHTPYKHKILIHIVFNIRRILHDPQLPVKHSSNSYSREGSRNPIQLLSQRLLMVHVHMRVADDMNELARLVSRDMRQQKG